MRFFIEKKVEGFRNLSVLSLFFVVVKFVLIMSALAFFYAFFPHALEMRNAQEVDASSLGGRLQYILVNGSIETVVICGAVYACYYEGLDIWSSTLTSMFVIALLFAFITRSIAVVTVVCLETSLCSMLFFKAGGGYSKPIRAVIIVLICNFMFNGIMVALRNFL